MPFDPNDPNQGSQVEIATQGDQTTAQLVDLNRILAQDPSVQQWLSQHGAPTSDSAKAAFWQFLKQRGYNPDGYGDIEIADNGTVKPTNTDGKAWLRILAVAGIPVAAYAATALAGAAAGSGAGAAGGAASGAGAAPALGGGATLGANLGGAGALGAGGAAAGGAGAAGAGAGAASAGGGAATGGTTGGGVFSQVVKAFGGYGGLANTGLGLLGAYLQSRAYGQATDAEIQAARDALGVQTQEYNQNMGLNVAQANQRTQAYNTTQANLAPYRGIGNAATSMAGFALGLPGYQTGNRTVVNAPPPVKPVDPLTAPPPIVVPGTTANAPTTVAPQSQQPPNLASLGQPQQPQATTSSVQMPQVGEQRSINGQNAVWDGRGWKAA